VYLLSRLGKGPAFAKASAYIALWRDRTASQGGQPLSHKAFSSDSLPWKRDQIELDGFPPSLGTAGYGATSKPSTDNQIATECERAKYGKILDSCSASIAASCQLARSRL
jgi:hypothetical protein